MPDKKVRCLYITFNGLLDPLGQSQVLPYIYDLANAGYDFDLISLEKSRSREAIDNLRNDLNARGIAWYRLKYFKFFTLGMLINIFQTFLLSFYLNLSKGIKIVHCRAYPPMFSVLPTKRLFGAKVIFDMRGFWPENLVDSGRIKPDSTHYKILKFLEKISIRVSDWVVTLTPESEEIVKEKFNYTGLRTTWMPTCVDEEKFDVSGTNDFINKFVLVYSGSLWSFYDVSAMADFFKVLKKKIKDAHFLILGNNEIEKLGELFDRKNIKKGDYTVLSLDSKDVPKYLKSSNLAVAFIYNYYSEKAAFPTKVSEYLAAGLPVAISTQCGYLKDIIISNKVGVVLDKFDNDSLEAAIDNLILISKDDSASCRSKMVAERYLSKSKCINKYLEIYKSLR
jgi:glycosyltransferase involved in cell wall biosynthesis